MYVCICNGYRETELRDIAQEGVASALDAYHALGNGPCCGRCLDCAQQIIDQAREIPTSAAAPDPAQIAVATCE